MYPTPTYFGSNYSVPPSRFGEWSWDRFWTGMTYAVVFPVLITAAFIALIIPWSS